MWDYLSRVQRTSLCEPVRYGTIVRGGLEVPKSWSQLPAEYDAVGAMMRELGKQPVFWPTGPAGESDNARKWRLRVNTHHKEAAAKSRHRICTSAWQARLVCRWCMATREWGRKEDLLLEPCLPPSNELQRTKRLKEARKEFTALEVEPTVVGPGPKGMGLQAGVLKARPEAGVCFDWSSAAGCPSGGSESKEDQNPLRKWRQTGEATSTLRSLRALPVESLQDDREAVATGRRRLAGQPHREVVSAREAVATGRTQSMRRLAKQPWKAG